MREWNSEMFCTASEAAALLRVSRPTFYQNVRGSLSSYKLPARERLHYKLADVEKYKVVQKAS